MTPQHYVGLISGTSMDGIDAVLADLSDPNQPKIIDFQTLAYTESLREELARVASGQAVTAGQLALLDGRLGLAFAAAAIAVLNGRSTDTVRAIGSHGQNVFHGPGAEPPVTLQLANPHLIAQQTGIAVVADFRRRDVALGGEGAPLAPALHEQLFRNPQEDIAVLNLGGIANLTLLPADPTLTISGFDTGPGNCLMDDWIGRLRQQPFDRDGAWAASGQVSAELLRTLHSDPWFQRTPPKSTGREYFNLDWLERHSDDAEMDTATIQATLCELTAVSVAGALRRESGQPARLLVCGGGTHNRYLLQRLSHLLDPLPIVSTAAHKVPPDAVEALLFAELARRAVQDISTDLSAVTGAPAHRYGVIYPA